MEDSIKTEDIQKTQKRSRSILFVILCATSLSVGLVYIGFKIGNDKVMNLTRQNVVLSAQTTALQRRTQQQNMINTGTASKSDAYKDPKGGIGLVDGKITFAMPQGWVRAPSESCSMNSIDSTVLCYDTAAIMPNDQSKDSKDPYWDANISVFEYKNTDGTARQWFEKYYNTGPLTDTSTPSAQNIDTNDVAGNSALVFQSTEEGAYVNGFYTVVHGSYAVVVDTQLQYGAVYGTYPGAQPFDYRNTYGPIL